MDRFAPDLATSATLFLDLYVPRFFTCCSALPNSAAQATIPPINRVMPNDPLRVDNLEFIPPHLSSAVDGLIDHLDHSVMLRVCNIPKRE